MKRWMVLLILALGFTVFSFGAAMMVATKVHGLEIPQSLGQCTALCSELFPGTPGTPPVVTPPVTPPVAPPPVVVKPFPHAILFENETDRGNGSAGIMFRTLPTGSVISVKVNGEQARWTEPYKGADFFLLSQEGSRYTRPLQFEITMSDGQKYAAVGGSTPAPGGTPSGTLGGSASILWKPVADSGGALVVLLPASMKNPAVAVTDLAGNVIETGDFKYYSNPNRATYRFKRTGSKFPPPSLLRVGSKHYMVPTTGSRHESLREYTIK